MYVQIQKFADSNDFNITDLPYTYDKYTHTHIHICTYVYRQRYCDIVQSLCIFIVIFVDLFALRIVHGILFSELFVLCPLMCERMRENVCLFVYMYIHS